MRVTGFRIQNFRSIVDTGWRSFSDDDVTVFIGQNESGKTSVLEALSKTFSEEDISRDDIRISDPLPTVCMQVKMGEEDADELKSSLKGEGLSEQQSEYIVSQLLKIESPIEIEFSWTKISEDKFEKSWSIFELSKEKIEIDMERFRTLGNSEASEENNGDDAAEEVSESEASETEEEIKLDPLYGYISDAIYVESPLISYFKADSGLLPNQVDISQNEHGNYALKGRGAQAARNFLTICGLDLKQLAESDIRTCENLIKRANAKITSDFSSFWSQTIGRKNKLELQCDVKTYGQTEGGNMGEKYLVFWINDGLNNLYPKQRSQGVRWFVSFYLQLKASQKKSRNIFFLLDEPGANLHAKAQTDVINLINNLKKDIPIAYSTHTPHMLEYEKLYRVLAVQRQGDEDDSPTEIKSAHEIGTASSDTLSPVLTAMGVDFSHQEVIKKENNVLLEEISGFYYLKAFWKLTGEKKKAHFIAATGVNKVPMFANMFLGWGLGYIIVLDDDKNGRGVYNSLKREIYAEDEELVKSKMLKIKGCDGIEDIFSAHNFKDFVIPGYQGTISGTNSAYMKEQNLSKPVHAYQFLLKVQAGAVKLDDFDDQTKAKIQEVVADIANLLK